MASPSTKLQALPAEPVTDTGVETAHPKLALLFLLYGMTGFSGLLAEQGFEKYVALLVGATASASAVVLFTYFLGFALGAVAAAKFLKQKRVERPLLAYGLVELLVGISCVAFSYTFHSLMKYMAPLQNLFGGAGMKFYVRFFCSCLLVLPTAALMGASFPLIASVLDSGHASGGKRWPHAYCVNLAGAFLAAVIAPFAIMPAIGLRGALWLCFGITVCVCAIAGAVSRPVVVRRAEAKSEHRPLGKDIRLLLAASFISGAVFFALEVIWTHLIGVVIGCSIYAFSWMLAAVLLGLLLGSWMVVRGAGSGHVAGAAALFQFCAILLLIQWRLWDRAPLLFIPAPPVFFQNSFYYAEAFKLFVTTILLVPAATLLGLIYPRLLSSPRLKGDGNSYLAGYLSAANSLGCISGALVGIFVLVPLVGSELSLKLIIILLVALAFLFLRQEPYSRAVLLRTAALALMGAALSIHWRWDWGTLTAGTGNYYGRAPLPSAAAVPGVKFLPASMIFRHEDVQSGLTTVIQQTVQTPAATRTIRTMYTNGKFQGDDDPAGENNAQFGFAAIPSLFVNQYDRALLIGLGTGHSATTLHHLGYREIEVAEFAAGIVQAARQCYAGFNEDILSRPGVKLHLEDGRNVLLTHPPRSYDLITIEVTSIWFAGSTNLYSREFYELARNRLKDDGVLQQWVQLHHVSPREIASELATARSVFPYVGLWYYGRQGMLVAASQPLVQRADISRRFQSSGMTPEGAHKLVEDLSRAQLLSPEGISRLICDLNPTTNTDHNRWIEYATPRYQSSSYDWMTHNREFLAKYSSH